MKKIILFNIACALLLVQQSYAQDCKTNADLDATPGKYITQPEYSSGAATATDKAMAKRILGQIEKIEQQSLNGFNLTGGNWESYNSIDGYGYASNAKLGQYTFQAALYDFFCAKGKLVRSSEYSTVLRIYGNKIPLNTLDRFLRSPFGESMSGGYDFNFQFLDLKNHKPGDAQAQLISLFTYMSCNTPSLLDAINTGNNYFQDIPEKDIKPNNYSNQIYRYWFVKRNNLPLLVPVSRKEYLQSLLEYYDREKLQFQKLVEKLNAEHDKYSVVKYNNWQADVADKIAVVKKALSEHNGEWLSAPAIINRIEDASQTYKAKLTEQTNHNRFWKFYGGEIKSEPLFKYNPDYFKANGQGPAKPQIATIAFRYVTMPSSLRIVNHFTKNFDLNEVKKLME